MEHQTGFLKILQSVDAFFPIGAFTLSNGLEDYVVRERIANANELKQYLEGFLEIFPYNDLGLLSLAYQNVSNQEFVMELDELGTAMKSTAEVRAGSVRMCSRYMKARESMNDCSKMMKWYWEQTKAKKASGLHPIALGIYAAEAGLDLDTLLTMYSYSMVSAVVNNTVKLVPLSQLEGQKILFEMLEKLPEIAERAKNITMDELGVAGCANELHCMLHEQLYSRQYMS